MVEAADVPMGGYCDPRFAPVREAFAGNFANHGEGGAAVCLPMGGRVVVDLCGGWAGADHGRPWAPDTLVNVFSIGKAMAALCAVMLASAGSLDVDAPVSRYWPAFAAGGKADVTVRQVLVLGPQAALRWTASPTPSVTGYQILRSAGGSYTEVGTVSGRTTTGYTDTSVLGVGSSYSYEIVAVGPSGTATNASASASTAAICL
jgi:hypothetical protein